MGAEIRIAEAADIPAIRRVLIATWHDTYDATLGRDRVRAMTERWHSERRLDDRFKKQDGLTLVAQNGGEVVATAHAWMREGGCLWLSQLYVLPAHQRVGVGAALLRRLLAAHPQAATVELEVEKANAKAVKFYQGAGFGVVEERNECLGEISVPTLILRLALPQPPDGAGG